MENPAGCTALVLYAGDTPSASPHEVHSAPADASGGGGGAAATSMPTGEVPNAKDSCRNAAGAAAAGTAEQRRFVGLSNQGATCYMNSLLQTLYMTPEVGGGVGVHGMWWKGVVRCDLP